MNSKNNAAISRREFARRAALASAAASLAPANIFSREIPRSSPQTPPAQPPDLPKLSAEGQAEVEARFQAILSQYGSRLSDAQKIDIRRLSTLAQPPLDRLRAFAIDNGDGPGLYLKPLIEHEKKPSPKLPTPKPAEAGKKP